MEIPDALGDELDDAAGVGLRAGGPWRQHSTLWILAAVLALAAMVALSLLR